MSDSLTIAARRQHRLHPHEGTKQKEATKVRARSFVPSFPPFAPSCETHLIAVCAAWTN